MIPTLYPLLVLLMSTMDDTITIRVEPNLHLTGMHNFLEYVVCYGILSIVLYLLYATTAKRTFQRTTEEMVSVPLAEAVKERE